ncbi:MAG: RNA methyltransferase [Phycisphaerales bacterium]|nr:RNA methyltransferase [Phycisphaerales bacterium]
MLEGVRVVLVSPSSPGNVGSVCRVMANMGLGDLVVVAPRCDPRDAQAVAFAAHGTAVLERLRVVPDVPASLRDCIRSYATTSKLGLYRRQAAITPEDAAREACALVAGAAIAFSPPDPITLSPPPPLTSSPPHLPASPPPHTHTLRTPAHATVAFAFGREDYGLRTEELLQFDRIVTIPADDAYPVMNLAAAVTVVAYELRKASLAAQALPTLPMAITGPPACGEQKQVLFDRLFDALERVGFLWGQSPDHLKYALRHLLGRVDLTVNEADILIGLARQIRWYVDHHPRRPAGEKGSAQRQADDEAGSTPR